MRRLMTLAAAMVLLAACGGEGAPSDPGGGDRGPGDVPAPADVPDDGPGDPGESDASDAPDVPPFTPGACDQPAYDWLPADQVGKVLWWEEDPSWLQPPEVLDTLLTQYGFEEFAPLQYGTRVFRVRYTTQDRGQVVEATTMFSVPQRTDGAAGAYPIVLWLHGTTGFTDACAPSRGIEGSGLAALMAALGYLGVAPDYIGMNGFGEPAGLPHPYLVGEATAIASWDAVRASLALLADPALQEVATADGRVAAWGGSQGGHAAMFLDRYAPIYAPEFEMAAVVAVVPPSDLTGHIDYGLRMENDAMANLTAFFISAARWYRNASAIASLLTDDEPLRYASTLSRYMDTSCGNPFAEPPDADLLFQAGPLATLRDQGAEALPPFACYLRENSLPWTSVPRYNDTPTLMLLGEKDLMVNPDIERASFVKLCEQGYDLAFLECARANHQEAGLWSILAQKNWLQDRLDGKAMDPARTCVLSAPQECEKPSN